MKKGMWVLKFAVFGVVMVLAVGWLTMSLWNWLVPALFAGPAITFFQALGLLILSKIFFWTFGRRGHSYGGHWGNHLRRKWNGMTAEEREAFRSKMKEKWCYREPNTSKGDSSTSNV
jgi:hypothetical protein